MIPKIIHYCWFGNNKIPDEINKYINSWKEKLPNYEFILWNEENFDVNMIKFTQEAYSQKKYAFVSDYARLFALNKYGGIYLDTDVEVIKDINKFLDNSVVLGFDDGNRIISSFIAAEKGHPFVKEMLEFYIKLDFINSDGSLNEVPNTLWMEKVLKSKYGLKMNNDFQKLENGIIVYPDDYFHAKSLITGKINLTKNTYLIHHHTLLWVSKKTKFIKFIRQKIVIPIIGKKLYCKLTDRVKGDSIVGE